MERLIFRIIYQRIYINFAQEARGLFGNFFKIHFDSKQFLQIEFPPSNEAGNTHIMRWSTIRSNPSLCGWGGWIQKQPHDMILSPMKWRVYHKRFTYLQKHHLMAQLVNTLDFLSSCFFDYGHKKWKSPPPPTTPSLSTTNNVITSIFITITFNMPPRPTTVWLQDGTTPSRNQQNT